MEAGAQRTSNDEKSDNSNGSAIVAGVVFGFLGAVAGALGYHYLQQTPKEPAQSYRDGKCAICLENIAEILILPCGHEYHKECIMVAKEHMRKLQCPKCRMNIPDSYLNK